LYSGYKYQYMDPSIDRDKYYEFTSLMVLSLYEKPFGFVALVL
jgi:hypothetical protein